MPIRSSGLQRGGSLLQSSQNRPSGIRALSRIQEAGRRPERISGQLEVADPCGGRTRSEPDLLGTLNAGLSVVFSPNHHAQEHSSTKTIG